MSLSCSSRRPCPSPPGLTPPSSPSVSDTSLILSPLVTWICSCSRSGRREVCPGLGSKVRKWISKTFGVGGLGGKGESGLDKLSWIFRAARDVEGSALRMVCSEELRECRPDLGDPALELSCNLPKIPWRGLFSPGLKGGGGLKGSFRSGDGTAGTVLPGGPLALLERFPLGLRLFEVVAPGVGEGPSLE